MYSDHILQRVWLTRDDVHDIAGLGVLLELCEDIGPRHVEAMPNAAYSGPEPLLVQVFAHQMPVITLDIADEHGGPTWLHDRCLKPGDPVAEKNV
jgi:hypothetical protein